MLYIIIAVLSITIIFLLKKKKTDEINYQEEEKRIIEKLHQKEIESLNQIELDIQKEKEKAYQEKLKIQQELTKEQESLSNYKDTKIATIESEIKLYREEQLNKIKQEIITLDLLEKKKLEEELKGNQKEHSEKVLQLKVSIDKVKSELDSLYEQRQNTLAMIKEEEELKAKVDYYRIPIRKEDTEDISQLRSIEKYLNNKDVLRKLIFKTYIETPMTLMFNRVGAKEIPGIYKITNIKNQMVYIGQSTNVKNRLKAHIQASLGISTIAAQLVHEKMSEEGLESFTFQLVEECDRSKLNEREKYWINYYKSNEWGYNKTVGGAAATGNTKYF